MTVLPPTNPDKVEQAVSAHLERALNGQRGRAAVAFRTRQSSPAADVFSLEHARGMRTLKIWAGAASALAACLAVVVTLQFAARSGAEHARPFPRETASTGNPDVTDVSAPAMDQVELSRDIDGGTAMLDGHTPVRVVRQQTLRQMQWFDPREKATYSVTEPGETVGYVRIQPY